MRLSRKREAELAAYLEAHKDEGDWEEVPPETVIRRPIKFTYNGKEMTAAEIDALVSEAVGSIRSKRRRMRMLRRGCDHAATLIIAGAEQVLCPICGASWQAEPLPWVIVIDGANKGHDVERFYFDDAEVTENVT